MSPQGTGLPRNGILAVTELTLWCRVMADDWRSNATVTAIILSTTSWKTTPDRLCWNGWDGCLYEYVGASPSDILIRQRSRCSEDYASLAFLLKETRFLRMTRSPLSVTKEYMRSSAGQPRFERLSGGLTSFRNWERAKATGASRDPLITLRDLLNARLENGTKRVLGSAPELADVSC